MTLYIQQSKKAGFAGYVGKKAGITGQLTLKGGEVLHAVQDAGVPFRSIAEAVAGRLGIPTKSLILEEAAVHYYAFPCRDVLCARYGGFERAYERVVGLAAGAEGVGARISRLASGALVQRPCPSIESMESSMALE
ncbi:hypothetical protein L198_06119 [Cryptococcus wingfieldii CBS 7118]|uniref:Uncharacterized protein n=1 Tax=Cryptococcus wingfieldii CBS 7118 TaxID=1295528 RepID=A0A1E3IQE0_9TREE|nr:hypothetical protein L198_06119 [Cryptococcus wingfieldii CBS 7118]ODN90802.1 hypothetical protein L198_06119 [Cryptococcus wingfieldii CBS 7118]